MWLIKTSSYEDVLFMRLYWPYICNILKLCYKVGICVWRDSLRAEYELAVGKEYEMRSSTDGLKLSTLTVNTFSTSNSQYARCAISVTFYNW